MENKVINQRKCRAQQLGPPIRALVQRLRAGQLEKTQLSMEHVGLP